MADTVQMQVPSTELTDLSSWDDYGSHIIIIRQAAMPLTVFLCENTHKLSWAPQADAEAHHSVFHAAANINSSHAEYV